MSFLDVLSCALGATVLLYLVLSSSARSNARPDEAGEATPIPVMLEVEGPTAVGERAAMRCLGDDIRISVGEFSMFPEWVDDDMRRRALAEVRTIRSMARFEVRGRFEDRGVVMGRGVFGGLLRGTGSIPKVKRHILVSDYSITPVDQNATTVAESDPRDPTNTIVTWYCQPSVYSAYWPRSPHLERLQVDYAGSSSFSSVGRWIAPAFNVRRTHELRVCGPRHAPTIKLRAALSGAAGQQCAEEVAPYIDGCYRAIFEHVQWSAPSAEPCLAPKDQQRRVREIRGSVSPAWNTGPATSRR